MIFRRDGARIPVRWYRLEPTFGTRVTRRRPTVWVAAVTLTIATVTVAILAGS